MTISTHRNQQIQKICEFMKDITCGMLTTVDEDGSLHSRPMSRSGEIDSDNTLWFFTYRNSHKVFEIEHCQKINVSFTSADKQRYISVSGTAQLVQDNNKMQELWQPKLQTWFTQGLDEADLALLKVNINKINCWDSESSFLPQTISIGQEN